MTAAKTATSEKMLRRRSSSSMDERSNSYTYTSSSYNGLCNSAAAAKNPTAATAACIGGSKSSCNNPNIPIADIATKASNETTKQKYYNLQIMHLQVTKVKHKQNTLYVNNCCEFSALGYFRTTVHHV
jgi:hypothetical protein